MSNLAVILQLWTVINNQQEIDEEWSKNIKIKQLLDALSSYPNEFWKYPVVIYYLQYHEKAIFDSNFLVFLQRLLAVLAARYVITPTINAVKQSILNLDAAIIKSMTPEFNFSVINEKEFKETNTKILRTVLKIVAYQHQGYLLPEKWEIEHILPKKFQSSYFLEASDKQVDELKEHIGNKIPFEKKLNITASNGYFAKKQSSYEKSKVQVLLDLSQANTDWGLDEIRERDIRLGDELFDLLIDWGLNETTADVTAPELIPIPKDRMGDYVTFIKLLKKPDSNKVRHIFLDI